MDSQFRMRAKNSVDAGIVHVEGEIDIAVSAEMQAALCRLLSQGPRFLIVDLQQVTFLDASGLRSLLSAHFAAMARGGAVILVSPTESVQRILDITRVSKVLPSFSSLEEAFEMGVNGGRRSPESLCPLAAPRVPAWREAGRLHLSRVRGCGIEAAVAQVTLPGSL